jgi:hypothetical protein
MTANTMPRTSVMMESGTLANSKQILNAKVPGTYSNTISVRESLKLSTMMASGPPESTLVARRSVKTTANGTLANTKASLRPSTTMESGILASTLATR